MAMGEREIEQSSLWVAASELPTSPGHPFYTRLNALLESHAFDQFVEDRCRKFYAPRENDCFKKFEDWHDCDSSLPGSLARTLRASHP